MTDEFLERLGDIHTDMADLMADFEASITPKHPVSKDHPKWDVFVACQVLHHVCLGSFGDDIGKSVEALRIVAENLANQHTAEMLPFNDQQAH